MTATVLAYGYEGRELKTLKGVCARLGLRLRRVDEAEHARPVGSFFAPAAGTAGGPAGTVPGRMVVLAHLTARQLDGFLSAMDTARAGPCLKAVLTEQNGAWTGPELYEELARERDALGG